MLAGVRTRRDIDQAEGRRSQEGHGRAGPRCAGPLLMLVVPPGSGTLSPTPGTASAFEGPPRPRSLHDLALARAPPSLTLPEGEEEEEDEVVTA